MSIGVALQAALSGLQVNQSAIDVTAANIANANTEGYSRKVVSQEAIAVDGRTAGVSIAQIERQVAQFLLRDIRNEMSAVGAAEVTDAFYGRMQDMFGGPGDDRTIGERIAAFAADLESLAATPESFTIRSQLVNAAVDLAQQINETARDIQNLRADTDRDIAQTVVEIDRMLASIHELNVKIVQAKGLDHASGDLEDQRDLAVANLAEQLDITTFSRNSGEIVVMTGSGIPLVNHQAADVTYPPIGIVDASVVYPGGFSAISVNGTDITTGLRSGRLAALVDMRDNALPAFNAELDSLTARLRDEVNALHNQGTGWPPPNELTGTQSFSGGAGTAVAGTGTVRIAVTAADQSFAALPLDLDLSTTATLGDVVIAVNTALAGVATAALNADDQLVLTATNPDHGIAIGEGDSQIGGRGFAHHFGLNDLFLGAATGSASSSFAVRPTIAQQPGRLGAALLSDIASGSITVGQTGAVASGDNRNAQALAAKFDERLTFTAAGGLPTTAATLSDYGAEILSRNAAQAANASADLSFRNSVADGLKLKADSFSGVNVDEELANLIVFQNAYSAAARIVSTLQEMFRILERMAA
ncbi:MAG: flagellar hook-associated protein FlgK [Rhodospirillaceae bacterium]|jgi:flagellar hook-associated protein 1|nr:flagellar hook-associated protein FlgK [Rhodospirillaceae bacterium]MBT6117976.1 flagellar hook-associated protein FlgK [Rhodospirillaceae bacterium]